MSDKMKLAMPPCRCKICNPMILDYEKTYGYYPYNPEPKLLIYQCLNCRGYFGMLPENAGKIPMEVMINAHANDTD